MLAQHLDFSLNRSEDVINLTVLCQLYQGHKYRDRSSRDKGMLWMLSGI